MNRNKLQVMYHGRLVGDLAVMPDKRVAFQYSRQWLQEGFALNPLSLPLRDKVYIPGYEPFGGLFGVFADSLPDGWGRLLVDRFLLKNNFVPGQIGSLERLAIVADSGMGALEYFPASSFQLPDNRLDLDTLAAECRDILSDKDCANLDSVFALGGSSGGARPKILTNIDGGEWIIKFPAREDGQDIGLQEYEYALCARECGIDVAEVRLFPSERCAGYFGTKRFDRLQDRKIYMCSVSGLLETSHCIPNLDYDLLMKLTRILCRDTAEQEKLFRMMCFNVYAHNRDDHSKNFSYLYDEDDKSWHLSPAYDMTYSNSLGGEHATTIHGNGTDPGREDILAVARGAGLNVDRAGKIADNIRECVSAMLGRYLVR